MSDNKKNSSAKNHVAFFHHHSLSDSIKKPLIAYHGFFVNPLKKKTLPIILSGSEEDITNLLEKSSQANQEKIASYIMEICQETVMVNDLKDSKISAKHPGAIFDLHRTERLLGVIKKNPQVFEKSLNTLSPNPLLYAMLPEALKKLAPIKQQETETASQKPTPKLST